MSIEPLHKNDIISRWKNGQSLRAIARDLELGRDAVSRVVRRHQAETGETDCSTPPASLGPVPLTRKTKLDAYLDQLQQLYERYPNLTVRRALEELRKLGYTGSYSTLRIHLKEHRPKFKTPTVRFETSPGAQAQMDWSSYTIEFEQEGRRRVELFSYILGYSRRQYICFTERQDFETTVRQHIAAFEHLSGAAAVCLYDNMKTIVTRWEDGQPIYNTRFLSFATHYGFKPWACQPRRPETKGKIERPFDYVEKNLLNGRSFRSLEHLNEVARWWLAEVNDRRIHGTTKRSPLDLHELEKPHLLELPTLRFDTAQVVYRIADSEGFISYADNRYSVPWRLIGQMLPVRILDDQLYVYNTSLDLVATHVCVQGGGKHHKQVDAAHLPPKDHHAQLTMLRDKFAGWGQFALEYFDGLQKRCRNGRHEASRILSLLHGYPVKDGQAAVQRAIQHHAWGYQSLERILAHFGTPKANWEVLSQRDQQELQRLMDSTRVKARPSQEYQRFFDLHSPTEDYDQSDSTNSTNQNESASSSDSHDPSGSSDQSSRQDPAVSGDSQTEDDPRTT